MYYKCNVCNSNTYDETDEPICMNCLSKDLKDADTYFYWAIAITVIIVVLALALVIGFEILN